MQTIKNKSRINSKPYHKGDRIDSYLNGLDANIVNMMVEEFELLGVDMIDRHIEVAIQRRIDEEKKPKDEQNPLIITKCQSFVIEALMELGNRYSKLHTEGSLKEKGKYDSVNEIRTILDMESVKEGFAKDLTFAANEGNSSDEALKIIIETARFYNKFSISEHKKVKR